MALTPSNNPPEWELFRTESDKDKARRKVVEKVHAEVEARRNVGNGMWWAEQRFVDQTVPSDMVNPDQFDHFNYRYQLYARHPPVQAPPRSLAEVTDEPPPIKYNVRRVAVDKPCSSRPWECAAHWDQKPWLFVGEGGPKGTPQQCGAGQMQNNNRAPTKIAEPTNKDFLDPAYDGRSSAASASCCSCMTSASVNTNQSNNNNINIKNSSLNTVKRMWRKCHGNDQSAKMMGDQGQRHLLLEVNDAQSKTSDSFELMNDPFHSMCILPAGVLTWCLTSASARASDSVSHSNINELHISEGNDLKLTTGASLDFDTRICPERSQQSVNNNASVDGTLKPPKRPREYTLRGFAIQDSDNRVHQATKLLCWPDKDCLDIPKDRVLYGKCLRKKIPNEPYDEDKDGPLLCYPVNLCPAELGLPDIYPDSQMFLCAPPPKEAKPKPGYGTYKLIGSRQYRERPDPCIGDSIGDKLPPALAEYRAFIRKCPNYNMGRYDRTDPANEMMMPSNIDSTRITGSNTPFHFTKNPRPKVAQPSTSQPMESTAMEWRLPTFIVNEMNMNKPGRAHTVQ